MGERSVDAARARLAWRDLALLGLVSFPFFIGLGGTLWGSEGRWTFVSQEMVHSGNWLEPRIQGEFYGDKPLLSYWLIALLATPFGVVDERLARLPSALAAAGVVWFTGRCAAPLLGRRAAVFSGVVVATAFSLMFWARSASADLVSLFFTTASIAVYLETKRNPHRWHAPLFFALLALGGHCKGMPAVLVPLGVAGADVLLSSQLLVFARRWRELLLGGAIGVALYLAPFLASRLMRGDWQLLYLMYVENFVRVFDAFDHTANVFYYVYTLPVMLLPWGLWLPGALISAARRDRSEGERFALLAFAVTFALFTASGSRRSYYILPIFPWSAMLIAAWWDRLGARGAAARWERVLGLWPAALIGAALCAAGGFLLLAPLFPGDLRALAAALPGGVAVALGTLACGAWLLRALLRGELRTASAALAAGAVFGSFVYATSVRMVSEDRRVERSFAAQVKQRYPGRSPVYFGGTGLIVRWYLGAGPSANRPEQIAQLLATSGSGELLVVCGKSGPRCLDGANGLRAEPVIEQWTPTVSRFVPAKHRFTLLRVQPTLPAAGR
jgi:4-amino-4-deoxy-L-arabinose transferase-like glycosyltransferase